MKTQRLLLALTVVNLALLVWTHIGPALADGAAPVLRGRALEIVDERGRVRASLSVLPSSIQANGETSSEAVLSPARRARKTPT